MKEIFCILFSPRTDTDRLLSCKFYDCFSCYVFDIYCPLLVFNVLSYRMHALITLNATKNRYSLVKFSTFQTNPFKKLSDLSACRQWWSLLCELFMLSTKSCTFAWAQTFQHEISVICAIQYNYRGIVQAWQMNPSPELNCAHQIVKANYMF